MLDLQFLHGSHRPDCDALVDKRFVGYSALQFIYAESIELSYNSNHQTLHAPAVWPTNPGPHIVFYPSKKTWHHYHVAVTGPLLDQWREDGLWPELPLAVNDPESLAEQWQELLHYINDSEHWQQRRAINILEKILLDILPQQEQVPDAPWLRISKERLEQGLDQQAVAKELGMGVSTFRRRFTEATNMCPQDWQVIQRIDQARELLLNSDTPIAEIAEQLNYCDAAHFARQFKKRVGVTPRQYRQIDQ